ncbi:MAG: HXXEE domain-containing protein [Verrucomicrobiota bacterium]
MKHHAPIDRLCANWVYGGFICSFLFLAPLAAYSNRLSLAEILFCLHLPAYMWHQYEEHDGDRFKRFLDKAFCENVLGQKAIFFINVFGVWVLFFVLILLCLFQSLGFGLGMVYLTLINAISHIAISLKSRSYNPGLLTSVLFFLPLTGYTLLQTFSHSEIFLNDHVFGLLFGMGIHILIVVYALYQWRKIHYYIN